MTSRPPPRLSPLSAVAAAALLLAASGASAQAPAPGGPQLRWTTGIAWRAPVTPAPASHALQVARPTPYMGSEWRLPDSGGLAGSGWRIGADLGLSLTPRSALRLGAMGVETPLEDVVRELRLAPVLTLGASYSF